MAQQSAAKLPIYRAVERLYDFSMDVCERLPKSLPYAVLGEGMLRDLRDCLALINLAQQAKEGEDRLELIKALVVKMTSVKTDYRTLYSRCSKGAVRSLNPQQYAKSLDIITEISFQVSKWWKRNEDKSGTAASNASK